MKHFSFSVGDSEQRLLSFAAQGGAPEKAEAPAPTIDTKVPAIEVQSQTDVKEKAQSLIESADSDIKKQELAAANVISPDMNVDLDAVHRESKVQHAVAKVGEAITISKHQPEKLVSFKQNEAVGKAVPKAKEARKETPEERSKRWIVESVNEITKAVEGGAVKAYTERLVEKANGVMKHPDVLKALPSLYLKEGWNQKIESSDKSYILQYEKGQFILKANEAITETPDVRDFSYAGELEQRLGGIKGYEGTTVKPESSTVYTFENAKPATIREIAEWAKKHGMQPETSKNGKIVRVTILGHDQGIGFRGPEGNSQEILDRKPNTEAYDKNNLNVLEFPYEEELKERLKAMDAYKGTEVTQTGKTSYVLQNKSTEIMLKIKSFADAHGMQPQWNGDNSLTVTITGHEQGYGFYGPDREVKNEAIPKPFFDRIAYTPEDFKPLEYARGSSAETPVSTTKAPEKKEEAPETPVSAPATGTEKQPQVVESSENVKEKIKKLEAENVDLAAEWGKILEGGYTSLHAVDPVTKKEGIIRLEEIATKKEANDKEIARLKSQSEASEKNETLPDSIDALIAERGKNEIEIKKLGTTFTLVGSAIDKLFALDASIKMIDLKLAGIREKLEIELLSLKGKIDQASMTRVKEIDSDLMKINKVLKRLPDSIPVSKGEKPEQTLEEKNTKLTDALRSLANEIGSALKMGNLRARIDAIKTPDDAKRYVIELLRAAKHVEGIPVYSEHGNIYVKQSFMGMDSLNPDGILDRGFEQRFLADPAQELKALRLMANGSAECSDTDKSFIIRIASFVDDITGGDRPVPTVETPQNTPPKTTVVSNNPPAYKYDPTQGTML